MNKFSISKLIAVIIAVLTAVLPLLGESSDEPNVKPLEGPLNDK